jgi:WD40 repeat protein
MVEPSQHPNPAHEDQDSTVVFISYAREDQHFARRLDESLRLKGVSVRGDWQLARGEDYEEQLRALILSSDTLIFVVSPDSAKSPACLAEVARAVEQGKRVLPVVCRDYDGELPAALRTPQWTFLREADDFVAGVQELIAAANTDFGLMAEHRRLLAAAENWHRNNRSRSFLLRKEGLKKAVEWLARTGERPNQLPKPTSLQSEYILASQRAQTRGARVAFGIAAGVGLALIVLTAVALAQRGLAKSNEQAALRNAAEAEQQRQSADKNAKEAERQSDIATAQATEAERQKKQAEENAEKADKSAKEAERQAGIARTNEQTAKTQQRLAEERRVEAERERRLAEDRALEERGARASILAQRPGREFEALSVALQAAGSDLKSHGGTVPLPAVVEGLDAAVHAAKYSLPLRGHSGGVASAAFSPDGSRLLTIDEPGTARLWDTSDGRLVASWKVVPWYYKPPGIDTATTFSRDGQSLVTNSLSNTTDIRDAQTGEPRRTLRGHTAYIISAAFSPDGTRVVTSGGPNDGTARIWDAQSGEQLAMTSKRPSDGRLGGEVFIAVFSPDGERLLTTHQDRNARLWNAHTGELLKTFREAGQQIISASFLPGGTHVLIGHSLWDIGTGERSPGVRLPGTSSLYTGGRLSPDGTKSLGADTQDLYLKDLTEETKEPPAPFGQTTGRHSSQINSATFSPDGRRIVTASQDGTARVWDSSSGETLMILAGHTDRVKSASFSPDGRYVVTASYDRTARIWDTHADNSVKTLGEVRGILDPSPEFAAISPDNTAVVVAVYGGPPVLWDARAGFRRALLEGHPSGITFAAFSPDSTRLVTSSAERTILWDTSTGGQLAAPAGSVGRAAVFSPDSRRFVTFTDDEWLVWNARDGSLITRQKTVAIRSAGFSHDGTLISVVSDDGQKLELYDARRFDRLKALKQEVPLEKIIAFSPDGRRVVTKFFTEDESLTPDSVFLTPEVRSAETGTLLHTLEGHTDKVTSAAFSPDGALIVTASADGTARVWDSSSGRQLSSLEGHKGEVVSAMFSPDSRQVVTAGRDSAARLWDARSGKQLAIFLGHTDSVNSAVFTADGRYVITASSDGTAKIYSAVESDLLKEYLTGALNLLRFQKEFDAVRGFEQYFIPQ